MPLAGGFPCPAGQALMYRIVYSAEKKQVIQEALARLEEAATDEGEEGEGAGSGGLASAVVALIAPESGGERRDEAGLGYDVI